MGKNQHNGKEELQKIKRIRNHFQKFLFGKVNEAIFSLGSDLSLIVHKIQNLTHFFL